MAGRNPNEAFRQFITPLREALSCVTERRLTTSHQRSYATNTIYSVVLNDMDPVRLKSDGIATPVYISIGQNIRVIETGDQEDPRGPYKVQTVEYFYDLRADTNTELLTFHWTPEAKGDGVVTFPHLHVERSLIAPTAPVRPRDFHKIHVPTGRVSVEAIIRLAITEFGAVPLKDDWAAVLDRTEAAFLAWRTRDY